MPYDRKAGEKTDSGYADNYGARFYPKGETAEEMLGRERGKKRAHSRRTQKRSYRRSTAKR